MNNELKVIESNAIGQITKAEIDTQIATAKNYPRSITKFLEKAESLATINEEIAQSCIYALPRGNKRIEGKSVRLAEIVCSTYGNIRAGARVIENNGKTIVAQGVCHDLENNNYVTVEVSRSILQNEYANGRPTGKKIVMNEDMQTVTGNAACAIAYRNAVYKVIPDALISQIYDKVKLVARGNAETLPERRDKAVKYLKSQGVKEGEICQAVNIVKINDIGLDELSTLRGMVTLIKNGESNIKELFPPVGKSAQSQEDERIIDYINKCTDVTDLEANKPFYITDVVKAAYKERLKELKDDAKTKSAKDE